MSCPKSDVPKEPLIEPSLWGKMHTLSLEVLQANTFDTNMKTLCLETTNCDEEDSMADTCSSLSTTPEADPKSPIAYENDDSDYSDYDSDNSCQEFHLKDWLKLAKVIVSKYETPENKSKLVAKYDELQDFFYFFALEYFRNDQDVTELVSDKRSEFVATWQDIIGPCDSVFDLLLDLMDDINAENSFRS